MTHHPTDFHPASLAQLRDRFAPVFETIRSGAEKRDTDRILPHAEVQALKAAGFGKLRVPVEQGGFGADLTILFALIEDLAVADSNLAQILRGHFGFSEILATSPPSAWRDKWLARLGRDDLVSPAYTETGEATIGQFSTRIRQTETGWVLDGEKYYTTGTLFTDWVDVGAERPARAGDEARPDGLPLSVLATVRTDALGVQVIDDWDGFGQKLTASGTARFAAVPVEADDIRDIAERSPTLVAFYQQYHLATLAGIGRAAVQAIGGYVAARRRTFSHASAPRAAEDPQVLQLIGRIQAKAASASRLAADASARLNRATAALIAAEDPDLGLVEVEIYEAQVVISDLVLAATTEGFSALGASSTARGLALDRYWRNARTIANHNPLIYKERLVGDYLVNGTLPPKVWRAGVAKA
jgi:alkylation response protein AidB-like acyl-CoA dehydrogenase